MLTGKQWRAIMGTQETQTLYEVLQKQVRAELNKLPPGPEHAISSTELGYRLWPPAERDRSKAGWGYDKPYIVRLFGLLRKLPAHPYFKDSVTVGEPIKAGPNGFMRPYAWFNPIPGNAGVRVPPVRLAHIKVDAGYLRSVERFIDRVLREDVDIQQAKALQTVTSNLLGVLVEPEPEEEW